MQNNILYFVIGSIGIYIIISSYFLSKILIHMGKSEIYWFFLLLAFYPFVLCFILIHPNSKNKFNNRENAKLKISLVILLILYVFLILPVVIANDPNSSMESGTIITTEKVINTISKSIPNLPDWIFYPFLILIPGYYVFVAYWVSTNMKTIDRGRSWFYSALFFHVVILSYILINKRYSQKLSMDKKLKLLALGLGYIICAVIGIRILDV